MPVYLITYEAEGSPPAGRLDRFSPRWETLPVDQRLASWPRPIARGEARFDFDQQRKLVDTVIDCQATQAFRCLGVASDPDRLLVLIAWDDDRAPDEVRERLRAALADEMNAEFGGGEWLSEGGGKRVRNRMHFHYLVDHYLPQHRGLVWTYETSAAGPRRPVYTAEYCPAYATAHRAAC